MLRNFIVKGCDSSGLQILSFEVLEEPEFYAAAT